MLGHADGARTRPTRSAGDCAAAPDWRSLITAPSFRSFLVALATTLALGCASDRTRMARAPSSPSGRSGAAPNAEDDRAELVRLARARSEALVRRDARALDRILADEFVYTNASGQVLDKADYLARYVDSPDVQWVAQDLEGVEVRLLGETAVVTFRVHDRARFGDQMLDAHFRSTLVFARTPGGWRCLAGHSSEDAEPRAQGAAGRRRR